MLSSDNYTHGGSQGYNRYTYAMNNPLKYTDPDGQIPFFVIPQIGWSRQGGLSIGLEVGVGVPGALSASLTGGYNFGSKQTYWSAQGYAAGFYGGYGSQGGFAGWGYRYAGFSGGISYGRSGIGVGVSYGISQNGFNGTVGFGWSQKGGWDTNIGVGYTYVGFIDIPTITKIAEFNLKNAPYQAIQQKDYYDCLITACTYIDQMPGGAGRSYEDIKAEFGLLYDSGKGSNTESALKKLYGEDNIKISKVFNPGAVGRDMELGNPSVVAQNNNHAIVVTKIEIFNYAYKHKFSPVFFNIQYMNPATGQFYNTGRIQSYNFPTFRIIFNKR
jgi:hypothetical protein